MDRNRGFLSTYLYFRFTFVSAASEAVDITKCLVGLADFCVSRGHLSCELDPPATYRTQRLLELPLFSASFYFHDGCLNSNKLASMHVGSSAI